jgi:hypothetical protein
MRSIQVPCTWFAVMVIALATVGCDDGGGSGGADMDALAALLDQSNKAAAAAEQAQDAAAKKPAAEPQPPAQQPDNETSITITVKNPQGLLKNIEPKDGKKMTAGAATFGEGGGYYSAIAGAHHFIVNRIDDWAWEQAVQHFTAINGRMPKDNAEFMSGVIKGFHITLPELEEGQEYFWVPEAEEPEQKQFGTLFVVRKQDQQQPSAQPQNP